MSLRSVPLSLVILQVLACPLAGADVSIPTRTTLFFESGGQHVNEPIDFVVSCIGYKSYPQASNQPPPVERYEVFSFNGYCPKYGCTIDENYYLNYRHIDSCSMRGKVGGKPFEILNYGNYPVDFSKCRSGADANRPVDSDLQRTCTMTFEIP